MPILMVLVTVLVLCNFVPLFSTSHASTGHQVSGYWLKSSVNFNTFGQFVVNETVYETTNSTAGLSTVTFGFPSAFEGHIAALNHSASSGSSSLQTTVTSAVSNNTVMLTVAVQPELQAGTNGSLSLGFYVIDTFTPIGGTTTNYTVPILFNPSVSVPVDRVVSSIVLPYLTTRIVNSTAMQNAGYSQTVGTNATLESWNNVGTNVSNKVRSANVTVFSDSTDSGAIVFTNVNRQISIDSSGQVFVKDTLTIRNNGLNTLTTLPYTPLTNSTTLTLTPSTDPPLSNAGTVTLASGDLDLNAINRAVESTSSETIILQYQLGHQYWNFSNGVYSVAIPTTSPVKALVSNFEISSSAVSGIILTSPSLSLSGSNATSLGAQAEFSYRMGIGSAFGSALPIASVLFLAVLIAGVIFRPKEGTREEMGVFDAMVKELEDKVSGSNDILSELKSKGFSVARSDLTVGRSRIEEFRQKTSTKLGTIRSQIPSVSSGTQSGLNELLSNDREFDRAVKEILNNYDQFISKRMKEETFARVQQNSERRLQQVTNALLDRVHDLREEYESEG